jgi:hypothetical protein
MSRGTDVARGLRAFQRTYFRRSDEWVRPFEVDGIEFTSGLSNREKDLLINGEGPAPDDVLLCSKPNSSPGLVNPLCQHLTNINGLNLNILYSRRYLPEWRKLKDQVRAFIDCTTSRT